MATTKITAIDVGTIKICTVVAEVTPENELRILGVGIGPSAGLNKGMVDGVQIATEAIYSSVERAERASGEKISSAHVGISGPHISGNNSQGIIAITDQQQAISNNDVERALESARIFNVPNNRQVIHVVPRHYIVDGSDNISDPVGMFGSRLDVETHVVTCSLPAMQNLMTCVEGTGVQVESLVLQPFASAEAVTTPEERLHGCVLVDIGGGTTDVCIYRDGAVAHTAVLPVGGAHMTRDLVVALRVPQPSAEEAKRDYGHAIPSLVDETEEIEISSFGSDDNKIVKRRQLAEVLQARTEELMEMVAAEISRNGDAALLSAGVILTGGAASLKGIELLAEEVLELPARVGRPHHLAGLSDILNDPAYATSVGLLQWALKEQSINISPKPNTPIGGLISKLAHLMRIILPQ